MDILSAARSVDGFSLTLVVSLSVSGGMSNGFRRVVTEIIGEYEGMTMSASKAITIPTPCDGFSLFLSGKEIAVLHEMIEEADTSLSVKDMISLF